MTSRLSQRPEKALSTGFFRHLPSRMKSTLPGISRISPGVSLISYCIPRMLVLLFLKSRTGPWTKSSLLIPNSSPFLLRGKWFHKRIPCDKYVSISAKSWTRSNQTATWSRKTLIPMGRSKSRSTAALSSRTSTNMSMN